MWLRDFDERHGKAVLVGAGLTIWGMILLSFHYLGQFRTWRLWHIPARKILFLDFRLIPGAAETFQAGGDPAVSNPFDPSLRLFNYPRIWYWLFNLKITQDDTIWISATLIILFFLIIFIFPEKIRVRDSSLYLPFIFSPACVLLYERGNVDLIFFVLCGLTILTVNRLSIVSAVILLIASFFKLFPFFGVTVFLHESRKRFYVLFSVVTAIFLSYVLLSIDSLKAAWYLTERGVNDSYGVYIIFYILNDGLRSFLLSFFRDSQFQTIMTFGPHVIAFLVLTLVFVAAIRNKNVLPVESERNLAAFRLGAAIYVGTFLLGNNWNYRLAFLLFTIPQISQWIFTSKGKDRLLYSILLVLMIATCWYTMIFDYGFLLFGEGSKTFLYIFDEIMNWGVFAGLTYLLIVSSPSWFRTLSLYPLSRNP